jgi:hypothetical protein
MNFKGFQPCGKFLVNSLKIHLYLFLAKVNLVGHTCLQEFKLP